MRLAVVLLVLGTACLPAAVGTPIRWEAVQSFKVGSTTPEDAIRELGPPATVSAVGPHEVMYGWSCYTYAEGRNESVFLRFRDGRLQDSPMNQERTR